ncbi:MAG: hypothetical protein C5B46_04420 [Proteobacteria bacterium]|nr:MAG: hypothetical protein C5B46_04420 [Pseudomonadota bacterium]
MKAFFAYVKAAQKDILAEFGDALGFCRELLREDGADILPEEIAEEFITADADERDYAVASAYSLLIGDVRRKELSAYFTPPALTHAVLKATVPLMIDVAVPSVLDPACGGGSFLTPVAREIIDKQVRKGVSADAACRAVLENVRGLEIDGGLAELSRTLLRAMLAREYGFKVRGRLGVVHCCDSLKESVRPEFDLVVGNPPYGRIGTKKAGAWLREAGQASMGGHTNLYTLFLMRGLRWTKPGGMLVYIVPASFVAGPYFAGLRAEIVRRAQVVRIDLHEQRENLFLGAVQVDICILTLRRHGKDAVNDADISHDYALGIIDVKGEQRDTGIAVARGGGEPWILPALTPVKAFVDPKKKKRLGAAKTVSTLVDYGYRVRVGKVVPTRERERLHDKRESGDLPLLWASTIRPDGSFEFDASARLGNARWYAPPKGSDVKYNTMMPAVVVQRTSNRDQPRRLNAAAVPPAFREKHKRGFVAENHVIVIEALSERPPVAPGKLAALLNTAVVNERFSALCGSFSVSAKLLARLALPDAADVATLTVTETEHGLRKLFAGIEELIAPSKPAGDTENGVNQMRDLQGSAAIEQDARLKRRAVA